MKECTLIPFIFSNSCCFCMLHKALSLPTQKTLWVYLPWYRGE